MYARSARLQWFLWKVSRPWIIPWNKRKMRIEGKWSFSHFIFDAKKEARWSTTTDETSGIAIPVKHARKNSMVLQVQKTSTHSNVENCGGTSEEGHTTKRKQKKHSVKEVSMLLMHTHHCSCCDEENAVSFRCLFYAQIVACLLVFGGSVFRTNRQSRPKQFCWEDWKERNEKTRRRRAEACKIQSCGALPQCFLSFRHRNCGFPRHFWWQWVHSAQSGEIDGINFRGEDWKGDGNTTGRAQSGHRGRPPSLVSIFSFQSSQQNCCGQFCLFVLSTLPPQNDAKSHSFQVENSKSSREEHQQCNPNYKSVIM